MSIVSVNTWGVGDELTTSQINGIDDNTVAALDKRAGQTDTLASVVSCSGAGRIVPTFVTGADADHTYQADGGNSTIWVSALTADRTYTLSNTNAVAGDKIAIAMLPSLTAYKVTVVGAGVGTLGIVGFGGSVINADTTFLVAVHNGTSWRAFDSNVPAPTTPVTITANQTYTVPRGITKLLLVGWGGGGGGGGGAPANTSTGRAVCGGGGGGAGMPSAVVVSVTPETGYLVTIGAGGSGGAAGANQGGDGGTTKFAGLAAFIGGGGGAYGAGSSSLSTQEPVSRGGMSPATTNILPQLSGTLLVAATPYIVPAGFGGYGVWSVSSILYMGQGGSVPGSLFNGGAQGGVAGPIGAVSGSYSGGGCGGGGGGAGTASVDGSGGWGGAANNAGAGSPGLDGTAPAAVGGGGGGGGGGGHGSASGGAGGAGADGFRGQLIIVPLR